MADSTLPLVTGVTGVPADSEDLICSVRARSNAAIAAHDLAGVAREWMADVHVVSAAGLQATGPAACSMILARQFAARPDTKYVRTPRVVKVFAPWEVASERGDWLATWTEPDGPLELGGTYEAQWRFLAGRWLIQGELFVPGYCRGGAYCERHP